MSKKILIPLIGLFLVYAIFGVYLSQNQEALLIDSNNTNTISTNKNKEEAIIYFGDIDESIYATANALKSELSNQTLYFMSYRKNLEKSREDAILLYNKIKPKHKKIYLIGKGFGSIIASFVSKIYGTDKLILVNPLDSTKTLLKEKYPLYSFLFNNNQLDYAKKINSNLTLILFSKENEKIPYINSQRVIHILPFMRVKAGIIKDTKDSTITKSLIYQKKLKLIFEKK